MNEWTHLFSSDNLTTAERYRRIENSPITWIARYFFKYYKKSSEPLAKYIKTIITGKTPPTGVTRYYETGEIDWFKPSDIGFSKFLIESKEKLSKVAVNEKKATLFGKNTLLINCIGDIGRVSILEKQASANQQITGITFNDDVVLEYAYYYFLANRDLFLSEQLVTTLPIINQTKIKNTPFICPSIREQHDLISYLNYCLDCFSENKSPSKKEYDLPEDIYKVSNRLFNIYYFHLDILRENKHQLNIVSQLKQAILHEAIAGQLTEEWRTQNPMQKGNPDTDAAALLTKIKAEKQQLIADGKLKKETKQESILETNLQIPDTWENPFLGDITKQITDGTHQTPSYVNSGKTFLSAQNVKPFRFIPANHRYITEQAFIDYRKNRIPEKGDLLIARVGAGIGETAVLDQDIEFAFYVSLSLVKVFKELTNSDYLTIVCNSPYGVQYAKGNVSSTGTSAGNYNLGRIRSLKIPLPPLAEQKVIVEKVDKLMNIIDQLEQQIKHRKQLAENLMQTVLREAFE